MGQEGFYDAFIFLTVITVASCILLSSSIAMTRFDDVDRRNAATTIARDSLNALLSSTLHDMFYVDGAGRRVQLKNETRIEEFLVEETLLLTAGQSVSAFSSCNLEIEKMARGLVTQVYDFTVETHLMRGGAYNVALSLGGDKPDVSFSAASDYSLHGESIRIVLNIWWA